MTTMRQTILAAAALIAAVLAAPAALAEEAGYGLNPGDVLQISVWKEPELTLDVLVRPDGRLTFPLVGDVMAAERTPEQVQADIAGRLDQYIPDAVVTVALLNGAGNKVYVLGKVARPGEYAINRPLDVMQALALAGGLNSFASENKIRILRRDRDGRQRAIDFRYGDVKEGDNLNSNIILISGDVVVVP